MKVIAIGAHPDDYEIGSAMRLIYHARMRDDIIGIICSAGEKGGDRETRIKEAILAARYIGMKDLHILSFPDTCFPDIAVIKEALEEIIHKEKPSVVYTHFPEDRHQDHRKTALASAIACRKVPSILTYQTPSTNISSFKPHLYQVGSKEDFSNKSTALRIHKSQFQRSLGVNLDQMEIDSRYYGSTINRYTREPIYAEPFCANHFILNGRLL